MDGVFKYFQKVSAQFERGVFNSTRFKSADFGQNRGFQTQKGSKIFSALRAEDRNSLEFGGGFNTVNIRETRPFAKPDHFAI